MEQVVSVRMALLHAAGGNLWQPLDFNAGAIGRAYGGDDEVNQALEQLLAPGARDQVWEGWRCDGGMEVMLGGYAWRSSMCRGVL